MLTLQLLEMVKQIGTYMEKGARSEGMCPVYTECVTIIDPVIGHHNPAQGDLVCIHTRLLLLHLSTVSCQFVLGYMRHHFITVNDVNQGW